MQSLEQFKTTYFQECDELLASLETHLSELARRPQSKDALSAAFRAIHSIKGGATMFRLTRLVGFAHAFETVLDLARSGRIELTRDVCDRTLRAADVLADLAIAARNGEELAPGYETTAFNTLAALCANAGANASPLPPTSEPSAQLAHADTRSALDTSDVAPQQDCTFQISFQPSPDMLRRGVEPLAVIRNLKTLGNVVVTADTSRLPALRELDPAQVHISWSIELTTKASPAKIRNVFEFAASGATIEITEKAPAKAAAQPGLSPESPTAQHSSPALANPEPSNPDSAKPVPDLPDRRGPAVDRRVNSIRVELDRVERLVDLVGEVTITQSMVLQHLDQSIINANPLLSRALSNLLQLSRSLQDSVMAIRAQPIRTIFGRLPRVVRESATLLGRRVEFETRGEATEIDKTIVEQLADPLMHIVRNAIDHGIEPPEQRVAAGKPESGMILITAAQRGGRIIVEVTDDGRGIDRAAVLSRAVSMQIVSPGAELTSEEIDNLVFSPGLSTAKTISDISGRGVGMDVVYKNIEKLGGNVSIKSTPGRGTTTSITLPLTLAVLDAMMVRCAGETYLVPLNYIVECIVADRCDLKTVPGACDVISVRGQQIRVVELAEEFGLMNPDDSQRVQIVLAEVDDGSVIGIRVDEICGHHQIVVKSIREHFSIHGISGATILGDGNVALILDVNQLGTEPHAKPTRAPINTLKPEARAA